MSMRICSICGRRIWWGMPRATLVKEMMYIAGYPDICEKCFLKIIKHADKIRKLLKEVERK